MSWLQERSICFQDQNKLVNFQSTSEFSIPSCGRLFVVNGNLFSLAV